jgi:hypothetical protein
MSDTKKPKPLVSFSVAALSVSLWENDTDNGDGTTRKYKTVTVRKSFSSGGQMDSRTVSISPAEVGCLAALLHKMEEAVIQHQETTPF